MEIKIERRWHGKSTTLSTLKIDGASSGYVLEDLDRGLDSGQSLIELMVKKIAGRTAIPTGTYKVEVTYSPRFKRRMPLLLDVPGFSGIRIHSGNLHTHTEGCPLPGRTYIFEDGDYKVLHSRQVTDKLEEEINAAIKRGETVWCEITKVN